MRPTKQTVAALILASGAAVACRFGYDELDASNGSDLSGGETTSASGLNSGGSAASGGSAGASDGGSSAAETTGTGGASSADSSGTPSSGGAGGGTSSSASGGTTGSATTNASGGSVSNGGSTGGSSGAGGTAGVGGTAASGGASASGGSGGTAGSGGASASGGSGGTAGSGGCADTNGGVEICDGVDNDCANGVDDGVSCPAGCTGVAFGGNGYQFCTAQVTWQVAHDNCEAQGLHLAKVDSDAENTFIGTTAFAASIAYVWLGGDDIAIEGSWNWQDGTSFWTGDSAGSAPNGVYTNWYPGYPRSSGTTDCLEMRDDYTWNDKQCGQNKQYVCELLDL